MIGDETLQSIWRRRGIDPARLATDKQGTVVPTRWGSTVPAEGSEATGAAPIRLGSHTPVEVGGTIGEGATAIVRIGRQHSLRREVAVKGVKSDGHTAEERARFVREARVTGALEHPNVVPVYDLGLAPDGNPAIVMKRIEGRSWQSMLERREPGADLQVHLEILMQVANAVHYAHSKGVLHRDLKPSNVMIGRFGEVYVVDWGLAVTLRDDDVLGLPRAVEVSDIAGTPGYMAPEMAAADGTRIREQSDVYLLGAILFELLTGRRPHAADSIVGSLQSSFRSTPPDCGPDVPRGLAAICHKAMAPEPADRFSDVAEFRDAILRYLRHRSSLDLSDQALRRLDELLEMLADGSPSERAVQGLFSECRFGFVHALRVWPDNRQARRGLQRALEAMIERELKRGSPQAAETWLRQLPDERPELERRVQQALMRDDEKQARLQQLERDRDPRFGERLRSGFTWASAACWLTVMFVSGYLDREVTPLGHLELGLLCGICTVFVAGVTVFVARRMLFDTAVNRRLMIAMPLSLVGFGLLYPIGAAVGVSVHVVLVLTALLGAFFWSAIALMVDPRLWWAVATFSAVIPAMLAWPEYAFELLGVGAASGQAALALHWQRGRERPAAASE